MFHVTRDNKISRVTNHKGLWSFEASDNTLDKSAESDQNDQSVGHSDQMSQTLSLESKDTSLKGQL